MKLTKWQELTKWLSKHPKFTWSQMNKAFGHGPSDLNSYTTYLNTIRRAGFVVQTARGQYRVLSPKYLATANRLEIIQYIQLEDAARLNNSLRRTKDELFERITAGKAENVRLFNALGEKDDVLIEQSKRVNELSHQIVKMDARARGTKLQRLVQVIRRELNR